MLRFLRITHLAVIDSVEVEFDAGLNVLTGETGAGKSILVEAVGLLLGGRASGDLVRTGEDAATIEAIFERGDARCWSAARLPPGPQPRVHQRRAGDGGALEGAGGALIELHGQHEHQTLLDPSTHLGVLDAFGRLEPLVAPVRVAFEEHARVGRRAVPPAAGDRRPWCAPRAVDVPAGRAGSGEAQARQGGSGHRWRDEGGGAGRT